MHITISDLELWTHIGITKEERSHEQRILVSLTFDIEPCDAVKTDNIEDTVDYDEVVRIIKELSKSERCTIEGFAGDIGGTAAKIDGVKNVEVTVKKFVIPGSKVVMFTHP